MRGASTGGQPIPLTTLDETPVPCGACTLCCQGDAIPLQPEYGDDSRQYRTVESIDSITGARVRILDHQANGDCTYLDRETGCTIYDRRPSICREYDCRRQYRMLARAERRRRVKQGLISKAVLDRGRALLAETPTSRSESARKPRW